MFSAEYITDPLFELYKEKICVLAFASLDRLFSLPDFPEDLKDTTILLEAVRLSMYGNNCEGLKTRKTPISNPIPNTH